MLERYPKQRPDLPKEIADIYESHFMQNRQGETPAASLSQRMEVWMHKQVARDVVSDPTPRSTLEIGAGTLNQLPYENNVGPYDIVEPFKDLFEGSKYLPRIRNVYSDINHIPHELIYDRITSIATFEHLCDLHTVSAKAGLLLKSGGCLRVAIPSEGTPLWTLGWKLTTGLEFRLRYGLDYGLLRKHEHVNTARDVEQMLKYFFREIDSSVLGISRYLSFYQFFNCKNPDVERCQQVNG